MNTIKLLHHSLREINPFLTDGVDGHSRLNEFFTKKESHLQSASHVTVL